MEIAGMALPTNTLQTVQTYQKAELAWLLNSFCAINLANKKFKNFQNLEANLGDTVTFDLPPRFSTYNGLVITLQDSVQRVESLVCSQASNVSAGYSDQQFIFNVRDYMDRFGEAAMKELGSRIESDILRNVTSGVLINNPQDPDFGTAPNTSSGPYRFFGNASTALNSYQQLAQAIANFHDYGAAPDKVRGILPAVDIPAFIGSGLNQFVPGRNQDIALSWMLGEFAECQWYRSNLLPTHVSGNVGVNGTTLTVVSTNDPTGANITQITFSGATASDANAIFAGDMFQFNDGVSGQPNMRFMTFIGHQLSQQPVQFRATAAAGANGGGQVTVSIYPALVSQVNQNQNLNNNIAAGMQVSVLPSHRAGLLYSGDQFYLAMPQLPDQSPFTTVSMMDKDSGASIRHYFGVQFGQNVRAYVRDAIWGSDLVADNSMRLIFPM
jgi:hypothetical protein